MVFTKMLLNSIALKWIDFKLMILKMFNENKMDFNINCIYGQWILLFLKSLFVCK